MVFSTGIQEENLEDMANDRTAQESAVKKIVESSDAWKEHQKKHPGAKLSLNVPEEGPKTLANGVVDFAYSMNSSQKGHDAVYGHTQTFGGSCNCGQEIAVKGNTAYLIVGENKENNPLEAAAYGKTSSSSTTLNLAYDSKTSKPSPFSGNYVK